jgi:Sodium/hydrogen exchanger family
MDILIADVIGDIVLVLLASSLLGAAARHCGQPIVIGQILVGVLLGPTVLGHLPGDLVQRLFPGKVLPSLTVLSQVAVVIFMFVVGYEINGRPARGGALPCRWWRRARCSFRWPSERVSPSATDQGSLPWACRMCLAHWFCSWL